MLRGNARIGRHLGKGTQMTTLVVVAVFSVQNAAPVAISFFFWRFDASLAIIIFLSALAGLVTGVIIMFWAHAKRAAREKKAGQGQPGEAP